MTPIGIIRKVDNLGRIVIPKEIRKFYHINANDEIEIVTIFNEVCRIKHCNKSVFITKHLLNPALINGISVHQYRIFLISPRTRKGVGGSVLVDEMKLHLNVVCAFIHQSFDFLLTVI